MMLSNLASIASVISGLAVLASLVYLSLQMRQNTKHSRALIQQGRAARICEAAFRIAELRDSDAIEKCFRGDRDVDAKELARFLNICRAIFISAEDSYLQHLEGLLDGLAFESFEASLRTGLGTTGVALGWTMTREMYEPQFRTYMDRMLGDLRATPGGSARSLENWSKSLDALLANTTP